MIKLEDGKLGKRELYAVIIFDLIMKGVDPTSSLFLKDGQNAGWFIPIIASFVMFIQFLIILRILKSFKNKGLIEIIYDLAGKYVGFILGMILFAIFFTSLVTNSRSYVNVLSDMFFSKTPQIILYMLLMFSAWYIAHLGFIAIGRTAWFIEIPFVLVLIAFILVGSKVTTIDYLFPIAGAGMPKLLKEGIIYSSAFGDIIYLTIVFPIARSYKDFKFSGFMGYGVVTVIIVIMMLLYITAFDYPAVIFINYPFIQFTRLIRFGRFFTSLESIFLWFWVVTAVIHFAIYLYLTTAAFAYTLKLNNVEVLILPITGITVLTGMIPENFMIDIFVWRRLSLYFDWIFFVFLTVLLVIMAKLKGNKQMK